MVGKSWSLSESRSHGLTGAGPKGGRKEGKGGGGGGLKREKKKREMGDEKSKAKASISGSRLISICGGKGEGGKGGRGER